MELTARGNVIFPIHAIAISMGINISRVGLEDFIYLANGEIAKNNVQIVESIVRIAKEVGRDIASVEETREIMSMTK